MTSGRKYSFTETNSSENHSTDDLGSIPEKRWRRASLIPMPWVRFTFL